MTGAGVTCDTSVLLPALMPWHERHETARSMVTAELTAVVAHVLVETFSVCTRLPEPFRTSPASMADLLRQIPRPAVSLTAEATSAALGRLAGAQVFGGRTYDGLVAVTAAAFDLRLVSADRRALATYRTVGVDVVLV